jgi:hypothetical protein
MDADAEFDALAWRDLGVALSPSPVGLRWRNSPRRRRLRNSTIAPSPVRLTTRPWCTAMRMDQSASERPKPRQNPVLVCARKTRVADDIGHKDRHQFLGLARALAAGGVWFSLPLLLLVNFIPKDRSTTTFGY